MLWCILSIATAFTVSTGDALTKKYFGRLSPIEMAVAASAFSLPFLLVTFPLIPIPPLDGIFWILSSVIAPMDVLAFYLYMKAIKVSPLSLCIPFLSFTPVFMLCTGFLMLGEFPNRWGLLGIFAVVSGSYLLHGEKVKYGYLAPFRAILTEQGSVLMLVVSVLFSVMAVLGKIAIQHSSPLFFGFFFLAVLDLLNIVLFSLTSDIRWKAILASPRRGLVVGLMLYLHVIFHTLAISMTKAVYMISVKRTSILFSVLYGWLMFGESEIRSRFLGAFLMFLGVLCITILG